jgi:hypothetical protein
MKGNPKANFAFGQTYTGAVCLMMLSALSRTPEPLRQVGPRWRNDGVSPASNTTGNLPQSRVIYIEKKFRRNLKTQTPFVRCAAPVELPLNSGNTIDLFMYQTLGADVSQTAEGTIGSGISVSVLSTLATIGEFADFGNVSTLALATAVDRTLENIGVEFAYRAGLSLSELTRNIADGENSIDPSVLIKLPASSTTTYTVNSINQIRAAISSLGGRSVPPPEGEEVFCGVMHPFTWGDCYIGGTGTGTGAIEILKHTVEGQAKIEALPAVNQEEAVELPGTGARFYLSNIVTQTTNFQGVTGLTALNAYTFGWDGVLRISLKARGDTAYGDGDWQGIKATVKEWPDSSPSDPSGMIGGAVSYRFHYVASPPPDVIMRTRIIQAASGIS